ncbi:serine/threonine-protein kinase [Cellulomonas alba]|uniref:non-specific serine/threonine protein kinase n=1 Tax=Cellulomonas alba TaxID=3053467 RepID=A0ABT7SJF9_9CELL|nr:serine/threonine-protein kinase [Cellulomonas alba]MDM7856291.1 serine/threonine-protein kinase [Cellulomonas alba]
MADHPPTRDVASLMTPPERATGDVPLFLGGRYRVLEMLGRGGASTVYRAHDLMLGRDVAVKVLAPVPPETDELRRHEAEMRVLSSLRDPGLVTLFDAGTDPVDGGAHVRAYLVMELVAGETLARRLDGGALSAPWAARVGWALAGALAVVHARDVVHRDVKPGNVLLTSDDAFDGDAGRVAERSPVKLADFGIARIAAATRLTMTGAIVGTATYLSPEQAMGGAIGPATDVYALGLVLLECLTGVAAFTGTVAEVAAARLSRDPEVPASADPALAALLRRMTARDPAARPTAGEVRDELAELLERDAAAWVAAEPGGVAGAEPIPADIAAARAAAGAAAGAAAPPWPFTDDEPTVLQPAVAHVTPPRRHAPRRRATTVALVGALVLGGATAATATALRSSSHEAGATATADAWTDGLEGDVAALKAALAAGRLEGAQALLDHAREELAAARRSGALPEAQLVAFARTLDGIGQQLTGAVAVAAAAAAQAQARLAASTSAAPAPTTTSSTRTVARTAPRASAPPHAATPAPGGKADHGPGSGKTKPKGGPGQGHKKGPGPG